MQTLNAIEFVAARPHDGTAHMSEWLKIMEKLPPLHRNGPWLVGGTVRRILAGEEPTTDLDIMFKNEKQFEDYCGQLRERGAETIDESDRQITFSYEGWEVQPIRAVYSNTLIQTLNKFDFTICQFGFDGTNFVWGDNSVEHMQKGELVFLNTNDHVSSMRRAFKYAKQGFFMTPESIAKFLKTAAASNVSKDVDKWEAEAKASGGFHRGGFGWGGSSYS
jgi:hypothetical protein